MALDTITNEKKEIIGYKPVNLIYTNVRKLAKDCKMFDGEYLVEWIF